MAEILTDAVTTKRLTMVFIDGQGDDFNVSVSKVKTLTDTQGQALVNAAMDAIMTNQPFGTELDGKRTAYETDTTKTPITMS